MSVIHVEDLSVSYGDKPVLWDIDVDVVENSITAIIGPNGAGKSTLLKSILGFIKPLSGRITLFDLPVSKQLSKIAYVPQHNSVNWQFPITVFEVVLMGRYQNLGPFKKVSKEEKEKAIDALRQMNLLDLKDRHIMQLSGGQKQRVFIARCLVQDADVLIMDEPLAGVDKVSEKIIMDKVKQLQKEGKTIICVHHDLNTVEKYFDHVILINRYIAIHGALNDVFTKENINKVFEINEDSFIV